MKLTLASVSPRRHGGKSKEADSLMAEFAWRAGHLAPTDVDTFLTEAALLAATARAPNRPPASLVLFDGRGRQLSSEEFAEAIRALRDGGAGRIFFCIGPANGWSERARSEAGLIVSLGRMTLPHELARVVVAEQVYRALTILAGHPYHLGHL